MEKIKDSIRMAVIGNSGRGMGMMHNLLEMTDVRVVAVCDLYEDRAENAKKTAEDFYREKGLSDVSVEAFTDYKKLLLRRDIDAVLITSSWDAHAYLAVAAMEAGKYAAVECGGACSVDECWQLVRTYEKTGVPCMFLENCCYGREEMTVLRMIKEGLFGELVHCEGGYQHDLRDEVAFGHERRHYRYDNYMHRCAEFYPAHELGPIQKNLNINRGNRMLSLTSMASKARGLHNYIVDKKGPEHESAKMTVAEGDIITTCIKCAHGETIVLTHDTTLPRPYSRGGRVQGTKGLWMEDKDSVYLEGVSEQYDVWEPFEKYRSDPKFEHPLWTAFRNSGITAGHGGMDWLVLRAFVESVQYQCEPPIDVYDGAALMCITPLSEASIAMGSSPVAIPDFTDGKWIKRSPAPASRYALDTVHTDMFDGWDDFAYRG